MTQPTNDGRASGTPLLIVGLLLAAAILALMAWDSRPATSPGSEDVIVLTSANWQREVIESKVPVLVDFSATWCGPCRQLAPTIDRLATRYKGRAKVGKVDVDQAPDVADKFQVNGIPHLIVFVNGKHKTIGRGLMSEGALAEALDAALAKN